jgi:hypothetical protein
MIPASRSLPALLCAALAASACQTLDQGSPAATANEARAAAPAPVVTPEPAPQVAARPPEPPINDDPAQLLGLDRSGVAALLGDPDLIRRDSPAEIWQYVTADCVLDVVLYANGRGYAVSYTEARDAAAVVQAPRPCLNRLLRARRSTPVS